MRNSLFRQINWVLLILFSHSLVPQTLWAIEPSSSNKLPIVLALEVYSNSLSPSQIRSFSTDFRQEIINTKRFTVYSLLEIQKKLTKRDREPTIAIEIEQRLSEAKKLYDQFKFESAAFILKDALQNFSTLDDLPETRSKIGEAFLFQAQTLETLNRNQDAKKAFLNAAALMPTRQLEPLLYSPSLIARFEQAKKDYTQTKEGMLQLDSNPSGAEISLNGKKVGTTPLLLKNFPLGIQEIKITQEGLSSWKKKVVFLTNGSKEQARRLEANLNQSSTESFLTPLVKEIANRKTLESQLNKIENLGQFVSTDFVFAARIEKTEKQSTLAYDLFMVAVDSKTGAVFKGYQEITSKLSNAHTAIAQGLQKMLSRKPPTQFTDLIAVESNQNLKKPFYKRWYFYTLLGLAVAGGGAGATVFLTKGSNGAAPPPLTSGVVGAPGRQP